MILNLLEECQNDFSNPKVFLFETDAQSFKINYDLINPVRGNFPHVGITAREGLCVLYYSPKEKTWLNVDVYTRNSQVTVLMSHMVDKGQRYKIMIYGPILSQINNLTVEVPDDNYSNIIMDEFDNQITVFGGIHSFGIGCTTVGVMFSNILSRKLNYKINNITFNDRNYLEKIYVLLKENKGLFKKKNALPKSEIAILELDYYNQDDAIVDLYLKDVVKLMKKNYKTVICWFTLPPKKNSKKEKIYEILENDIKKGKIILEDCSFLYDEEYYDMCTFGYHFINDAGNIMIFKKLAKKVQELDG